MTKYVLINKVTGQTLTKGFDFMTEALLFMYSHGLESVAEVKQIK